MTRIIDGIEYHVTELKPCRRGSNRRGITARKRTKRASRAKGQMQTGPVPAAVLGLRVVDGRLI